MHVGWLIGLFEAHCCLWIISYCFLRVADSYCLFSVDLCFLATGHVCSFLFLIWLFDAHSSLWIISYCLLRVADSCCVSSVDDCFLATGHVCSFMFFHCYFVFPLLLLHVLTQLALGRWIFRTLRRLGCETLYSLAPEFG